MGSAVEHATHRPTRTGPAWAGLRFGPRPPARPGRGGLQRLPLALASLAIHGLLIAALLQAAPRPPESGNSLVASERVQLRFVSAHNVMQEQGAGAPATQTAARAAPAPAEAVARPPLHRPRPLAETARLTLPEPVPPSAPAASPKARPSAAAAPATVAGQPDAGRTASAGRGQGIEGQGSATQTRAPAQDTPGVADWSLAVMRQLARYRTYPASARAQRMEGVVMVQATIAADGQVLATRLRHSCGNPDLDAEALATFQRARRLPAPPAHLPSPLQVDLPVAFRLRG